MFKKCTDQQLAIAWSGLPPYAAYCLAKLVQVYPGRLTIMGTKADVPHEGIEAMIGQKVHWLEREQTYRWDELDLSVPDHFIHTGWAYQAFNSLGAEAQATGAKRYSMIDTIWYGTWRQWVGLLYFRLVYRRWFDAVLVPGKAGYRFSRRMGMPGACIHEGLYGANPEVFTPGPPLSERPKRILFVGRLIERKGVLTLLEAIRKSCTRNDGWEFVLIGAGPLEEQVRAEEGVRLEPFSSPDTIAEWMRGSRYLVLPSQEENWGVVVHEASLSGCGLILAEEIGAAADLISSKNGVIVRKGCSDALSAAFLRLSSLGRTDYQSSEQVSLELASKFGPKTFVKSLNSMIS